MADTRRMFAEIVCLEIDDPKPMLDKLLEHGFTLEETPDGDGLCFFAWTITTLEQLEFFHHVEAIVDPLGGTVIEAGLPDTYPVPKFA